MGQGFDGIWRESQGAIILPRAIKSMVNLCLAKPVKETLDRIKSALDNINWGANQLGAALEADALK